MTLITSYGTSLARAWASVWRFRALALAQALRERLPASHWKHRQLFGYEFHVDIAASNTHALLWLEGERLIAERFLLRSLLSPGMHVVDVGANLGYYLLLILRSIGPSGSVCLIEPSPENLPHFHKQIAANGFHNVVLHPVAVGEAEGTVGLRSGINSGVTAENAGAYQVPIKPLDAVTPDRVDALKIDVEGFELDVLRGAAHVLQRDQPILFLEVHPHILPRFGTNLNELLAEVKRHYDDFDLYYLPATSSSLIDKLSERYGWRDSVIKAHDVNAFLANSASFVGSEDHTFWLVARPSP